MSNLLTSLGSAAASSMDAFLQGLNVVQSNVTNASTPGYAKLTQTFLPDSFDISGNLPGGVSLGAVLSSRDEYAETAVRRNQSDAGAADQTASGLTQIQPIFDLTAGAGLAGAINQFFGAVSELSVSPNDNASRQAVLDQASGLAGSFNATASGLISARAADDTQLSNQVSSINQLLGQIANYNKQYTRSVDASQDPALDAGMHNSLDSLSELVNFQAFRQGDGSIQLQIGGGSLGVIGDKSFPFHSDFSSSAASVVDSQGKDISAQIPSGKLGALLRERNTTIPSYLSDLDTLASTLADKVNSTLGNGLDANGNIPATQLFQYDAASGAAQTLTVNPLAPSDLAAASASAPGGNSNALALADLGRTAQVNGFTFSGSYGNLAGRVGRDLSGAQGDQQTTTSLLNQAQALRASTSGVSLDEEAAKMLQFQRGYEAAAKMVTAISEMTVTLLGIIT